MRDKQIGLVGMWTVLLLTKWQEIKFKDQDGIAIMKEF